MKNISKILTISAGVSLLLIGCSKQEEPVPIQTNSVTIPPTIESTQKIATNAVVIESPAPVVAAREVVKPAEEKAPEIPATTPVPPAEASAEVTAQGILQRAQALVMEKKYPEALAALSELSNVSLTTEQQNLLARLKTEISNGMTSKFGNETVKSVGDLFKK